MIICFKCDASTKASLEILKARFDSEDYSDVISNAVQIAVVVSEQLNTERSTIFLHTTEAEGLTSTEPIVHPAASQIRKTRGWGGVPTLFKKTNVSPSVVAEPPTSDGQVLDALSPDRWVFGQRNRLLPAKAASRAFANLLVENPELAFPQVCARIGEAAVKLGVTLREFDQLHGLNRDNAVSLGFPKDGKGMSKSIDRFVRHFIGSLNKSNEISGLLFDLKLINWLGRGDSVALTQVGWDFARQPSPILDHQDGLTEQRDRLGDKEVMFLRQHIQASVPREWETFTLLRQLISKGHNTPAGLDEALRQQFPQSTVSDAFLSTQRSGAVSRMEDLHLIYRERDGIHIKYHLRQ